ncbi:MAG: type I-F CRISPR-associated protein Csy2 [SAR86 cluster bacterium]|uniref:Type I-F CRISPR-associated protein Csy2 n=1 Tax=SAR86 cluster bacterium TaxID=2030880 RepID=A0A2A5C6T4_9GAMM|nr:MAG: type I-F CRISPR-associated protein Csy2 [SAR86 cluster bacterium]
MSYKKILLLPHLRIHNANALSSPFTIGFPAMTAWLGVSHALQRKLNEYGIALKITSTGIVSHQMDLQTYRGGNDYVSSIISTGNPLVPKKKKVKGEPWSSFERPSFIEEARCHLDVSLLIELQGISQEQDDEVKERVTHLLNSKIKIAGGDIQGFNPPDIFVIEEGNDASLRKLTRKVMPGYVLIERRDLMLEAMQQGQDAMDALIDYVAIHHSCEQTEDEEVLWKSRRKTQKDKPAGWVVPIATGFHGISELGQAKNQRDPETPHRFAESLVTLGEFKMPHRFDSITQMLWRYHVDGLNNLYQCLPLNSIADDLGDEFA